MYHVANSLAVCLQANWRWGYWVPDMTIKCYQGWHLGFSAGLGVPLLLLVAVAIPFLPAFLLFKYKTKLKETSVKIRVGFLYHSYRCDCSSAYGGDLHAMIEVMTPQLMLLI